LNSQREQNNKKEERISVSKGFEVAKASSLGNRTAFDTAAGSEFELATAASTDLSNGKKSLTDTCKLSNIAEHFHFDCKVGSEAFNTSVLDLELNATNFDNELVPTQDSI